MHQKISLHKIFISILINFMLYPIIGMGQSSDCANAIEIISDTICNTEGFSVSNSYSGSDFGSCVSGFNKHGWYWFQAIGTTTTIDVSGGNKTLALVVWDYYSSCGALIELACNDIADVSATITFTTIIGNRYLIQIVRTQGGGGTMAGDICVYSSASVCPACLTGITNLSLEGAGAPSTAPIDWQQIPLTDVNCQATDVFYATVDQIDIATTSSSGILPHSGNAFSSGLHMSAGASIWHEGIEQFVSGFTIGDNYNINFWQSVVLQSSAIDPTGSWAVYVDNTLIAVSATSTTPNSNYADINLVWESRSILFTATSTSHTIKFLPMDDDANTAAWAAGGGLRMGIDDINIECVIALPVELLSFTATQNNNTVQLGWSTTNEINNDYFEIERSIDGFNFEGIGEISGAGNSNQLLSYLYQDTNPYNGVSYYRLKQTDFDGKSSYSDIVAIQIRDNEINLTNTANQIIVNGVFKNVEIELYNSFGQLVVTHQSSNNIIINKSNYASGVYLVKVNFTNESKIWKVIF